MKLRPTTAPAPRPLRRLLAARCDAHRTLREVAAMLGLTPVDYGRLERGVLVPAGPDDEAKLDALFLMLEGM